ncbi:hypothetical protein VTN31DRAFT_805 [Thermomyces dupontii]|uniref:uncharacterized protein n=1 Tax=Talaromyces thermophilus TaxID=28565 RepID=UPI00374338E9
MAVELQPTELGFRRPFNVEVSESMFLRNLNNEPVAFKVKTTAPKHYCVRPNSGRIEPGKSVEVQVLLQAMKEDPPLDAKCKDKFLVQSVAITGDYEYSNIASIFEKVPKSAVQERKIRVNYLPPLGATNGTVEEEPPSFSSPTAPYETPAPGAAKRVDDAPIAQPQFAEKTPKRESPPSKDEKPLKTEQETSSVSGAVSAAADDVKERLADALAQIDKLKKQLAEQGLRQRKADSAESTLPQQQQQLQQPPPATEAGVPVQIVAGLCLLSFLLAYIFF